MPFTPDPPFPKNQGDNIRSKDWNDAVKEVVRLDTAKLNLAGGNITGPLNVSGNLGLGTTNPQAKLEVVGKVYINRGGAPDAAELRIYNGGAVAEWTIRQASGTSHDLNFSKLVSGTYTDMLTLDVNGNLGIGTTNPSNAKLVIGGVTSWGNGFGLTGNSGSNGVGMYIENTAAGGHKYALLTGGTATGVGMGGFGVYDDTVKAYRLAVDASGQVGIGNANPEFRLDVSGRIRLRKSTDGSAGLWLSQNPDTSNRAFIGLVDDTHVGFWGNAGASWAFHMDTTNGHLKLLAETRPINITATWQASPDNVRHVSEICNDTTGHKLLMIVGNRSGSDLRRVGIWDQLLVGGSVIATSDVRMKEEVRPLTDSLASVLALRGVSFKWRRSAGDGRPPTFGLVAQEVEKVFPELVEDGADGMKALNYLGLIGPLVEAIKEQHELIAELRAEVDSLKAGRGN